MRLKIGDRVRHATGGPEMVVEAVSFFGRTITCVWWDATEGDFVEQEFAREALWRLL